MRKLDIRYSLFIVDQSELAKDVKRAWMESVGQISGRAWLSIQIPSGRYHPEAERAFAFLSGHGLEAGGPSVKDVSVRAEDHRVRQLDFYFKHFERSEPCFIFSKDGEKVRDFEREAQMEKAPKEMERVLKAVLRLDDSLWLYHSRRVKIIRSKW